MYLRPFVKLVSMDYLWEQLRHKMLLDLWQKSSKFVDETDLLENNLQKYNQVMSKEIHE